MAIRLPLFWRTWTWARASTCPQVLAWHMGRDYSYCRALELTDHQVSGFVYSWFLENAEKRRPRNSKAHAPHWCYLDTCFALSSASQDALVFVQGAVSLDLLLGQKVIPKQLFAGFWNRIPKIWGPKTMTYVPIARHLANFPFAALQGFKLVLAQMRRRFHGLVIYLFHWSGLIIAELLECIHIMRLQRSSQFFQISP